MTGLKDFIRKHDKIRNRAGSRPQAPPVAVPEIKLIRTTTDDAETIDIPVFPGDKDHRPKSRGLGSPLSFRHSSNAVLTRDPTALVEPVEPRPDPVTLSSTETSPKSSRRSLHFRKHSRSRSRSVSPGISAILPVDLPDPPPSAADLTAQGDHPSLSKAEREEQWTARAAFLAQRNPLAIAPSVELQDEKHNERIYDQDQDNVQTAIALHERDQLEASTQMFARLAARNSADGDVLAQVLYGLALRHGWGLEHAEQGAAVRWLAFAAANASAAADATRTAAVSTLPSENDHIVDANSNAWRHPSNGYAKSGTGASKAELVLAMFELANCFRFGWGVAIDPRAARVYYEVAAELGDVDGLEAAAWCFIEGFGGPKDKVKAAQFLRLAEEKGSKVVGNSWIWKDKYDAK